jgi:hypothetical protein
MITLAQAVADLIAAPRPILFLDTCTLLDIVRASLRDLTAAVRAGVELQALVAAGTVWLFVQDIVPGEWADNLPVARRDGEAGVRAFTATWQLAADLGQPTPPLPVLPPGTLIDELEQLSRDLLMAADTLDRDHAGMPWVIDRVAAKQKPSSAKGTVKDCHILGHALRLSTPAGGRRIFQLAGAGQLKPVGLRCPDRARVPPGHRPPCGRRRAAVRRLAGSGNRRPPGGR